MKLHLPYSLRAAILAVLSFGYTQAAEIPATYETIDIWAPDIMDGYSSLQSDDYAAFLLYMDSSFSAETMGTLTPGISGGNIIITTAEDYEPVKADFSGDFSFYNNTKLEFNTLSHLSFDCTTVKSSDSGSIYTNAGSLIITNVNDGIDSTNDVVFNGAGSNNAITADEVSSISISQNGKVIFNGYQNVLNSIKSNYSNITGGAICSNGTLTISDNSDVIFFQNTTGENSSAYNINAQEATGRCMFYGPGIWDKPHNSGGAVHAKNCIISRNNNVIFENNTVSHMIMISTIENICGDIPINANGGALAVSGRLDITNNTGTVLFRNNKAQVYAPAVSYGDGYIVQSCGGAVAADELYIQGNSEVIFEKNCEIENGTFRLRSLYVNNKLTLSAPKGGHITFYDSVYSSSTVLNADYTDANGITQHATGDIIFTGAETENHLRNIMGEDGELDEIEASQTSSLGVISLYGGSLQVVDGAKINGLGLTVAANSMAQVLLRNAGMNHDSYNITFNNNTTLELQGRNTITAKNLTLGSGVSLSVALTEENLEHAALTLRGDLSTDSLTINLNLEGTAQGMYQIINMVDGAEAYLSPNAWTAENITVNGRNNTAGASFYNLVWQEGALYYVTGITQQAWNNAEGNRIWSTTALNWTGNTSFNNGANVIFADTGAGEVILSGELAPGSITVNNVANNDYIFTAAENGGKLTGATGITKKGYGELTITTANEHTGNTDLQEGSLNVHHSTALGATAEGGASLTAAAGSTLRIGNDSHLVLAGSGNSLAGVVEVSDGSTLEMKSGGYAATSSTVHGTLAFTGTAAATTAAGSLSGTGTVKITDSQVKFASHSDSFTGNLEITGKKASLNFTSGSYKGAGHINVNGGTLTFGASADLTVNGGGALNMAAIDDAPAELTARYLNVKSGAILSAKQISPESLSPSIKEMAMESVPAAANENVGAILNCTRLTLNAGATLELDNAHFDMSGGTLILAVPKSSTSKIELVLAPDVVYAESTRILLFSNMSSITLIYDGKTINSINGSIYNLNATDYFTGAGITAATNLVYDCGQNVLYLQGVEIVPEPATTTLSLLALSALAARRRRR